VNTDKNIYLLFLRWIWAQIPIEVELLVGWKVYVASVLNVLLSLVWTGWIFMIEQLRFLFNQYILLLILETTWSSLRNSVTVLLTLPRVDWGSCFILSLIFTSSHSYYSNYKWSCRIRALYFCCKLKRTFCESCISLYAVLMVSSGSVYWCQYQVQGEFYCWHTLRFCCHLFQSELWHFVSMIVKYLGSYKCHGTVTFHYSFAFSSFLFVRNSCKSYAGLLNNKIWRILHCIIESSVCTELYVLVSWILLDISLPVVLPRFPSWHTITSVLNNARCISIYEL